MPFPPALTALSSLIKGEEVSQMQKQAVSSSLFHFISLLLPQHVARDEILVRHPCIRYTTEHHPCFDGHICNHAVGSF
jgi:hypothetical protein